MNRIKQAAFALSALTMIAAAGCLLPPPPSVAPQMPRRGITPRSYKMKLAVFNLLDPTGSGGRLTQSIAETLQVELFKTRRFELMERAEVRGINPADKQRIMMDYRNRLDGLVVGSITHFDTANKTINLNINVMNPWGTTMAANSFEVRYTGTINVDAGRRDITLIAEWTERAFPKLESGLVLSRSADRITLNLGSESGVHTGMWVLVASRGDMLKDPQTGEPLGSDIYVGEAFVIGVNPATSEALVVQTPQGKTPQIKVHDKVIFK